MATRACHASGTNTQRRQRLRLRLRLEISREASRLFWERGVAATSGDQIARAAGLSTRTIWRHFRNKESCAEPIVAQGVEWEMSMLRSWPRHLSLERHFTLEAARRRRRQDADPVEPADALLARKMIRLADDEPSIRTAWLMACDQMERETTRIVADRLGRPAGDSEVRLHGAAISAALRVVNERIGADPCEFTDVPLLVAQAVRNAAGGDLGDALAPTTRTTPATPATPGNRLIPM